MRSSVGLHITRSFALAATFCLSQGVQAYIAASTPNPALVFVALQTHMPTKQGNVPHLQPQEPVPSAQAKIKLDPDQLRREARELLKISQSLQSDIESLNHGLHPKDTLQKFKRIHQPPQHFL